MKCVCAYLTYKDVYRNGGGKIPEFVIEPENILEVFMAADFLQI